MTNKCLICLSNFGQDTVRTLRCGHKYHKTCLTVLYRSTKNVYDESLGGCLEPQCPRCLARIHSDDIRGGPRVISEQERAEADRLRKEPSYAGLPHNQRPLRLARYLVIIERSERERALNDLIARREKLLRRNVIPEESTTSTSVNPEILAIEGPSQASSSPISSIVTGKSNFRPILVSEPSSSPSSVRLVIDSQKTTLVSEPDRNSSASIGRGQESAYSQQHSPILHHDEARPASAPPTRVIFEPPLGSSQRPIVISSTESSQDARNSQKLPGSSQPNIKVEPKIEPFSPGEIFQVKLLPVLKREPKVEAELQEVQLQINVISTQLEQMDATPSRPADASPPHIPDDDSFLGDDEGVTPVEILGYWARGRHCHYRTRWSNGMVSLCPTREVENSCPEILDNYRRQLRRQAVARCRLNQATGRTPKVPGRGRGRPRKDSDN